jgi:hypothetical protein
MLSKVKGAPPKPRQVRSLSRHATLVRSSQGRNRHFAIQTAGFVEVFERAPLADITPLPETESGAKHASICRTVTIC